VICRKNPRTNENDKEIGQQDRERYSSQLGGSVFDAHSAHFSGSPALLVMPERQGWAG
jgi:hypothetical protein